MRRSRHLMLVAAVGLTLALAGSVGSAATASAAPASATSSGNPIINDCFQHGQLTGHYTVAQFRHALHIMPTAVKQYSDCYDVINTALIKAASHKSGGGGSGGSGGSFLPTPLLIVLIVLALAVIGFGVTALRRRQAGPEAPGPAG